MGSPSSSMPHAVTELSAALGRSCSASPRSAVADEAQPPAIRADSSAQSRLRTASSSGAGDHSKLAPTRRSATDSRRSAWTATHKTRVSLARAGESSQSAEARASSGARQTQVDSLGRPPQSTGTVLISIPRAGRSGPGPVPPSAPRRDSIRRPTHPLARRRSDGTGQPNSPASRASECPQICRARSMSSASVAGRRFRCVLERTARRPRPLAWAR